MLEEQLSRLQLSREGHLHPAHALHHLLDELRLVGQIADRRGRGRLLQLRLRHRHPRLRRPLPRPAGPASSNKTLLEAPGLIDEAPVTSATQNNTQPNNTVSGGPNAGVNKVYSASNEDVDGGMGGTVYGPMKPFGATGSNGAFSNNVKR